ncbi:MAG TPA: hypothetical protein DGG95_09170, partial [Cytophagales bacterium]|nr:hypothetical protein [Cytophagales bacterium]
MKNNIPILAVLFIAFFQNAFAQVPTITSFSPTSGPVGTSVTIIGTNFSATPSNNTVYFGATKATVNTATATQLIVTVPIGATYNKISETVSGLTGFSNKPFIVSIFPTGAVINPFFSNKVDFSTGTGTNPYSVALGDFDGDGKSDFVSADWNASAVSVFRNISSTGSITTSSFNSPTGFATGPNPYWVSANDIDGDGKLDLVVVNSNNTISIFRNTSTVGVINGGSFATKVDFATGTFARSVDIGELDGDGKPDIVVTDNTGNTISVLRNTSTSGSITTSSFAAKVDFATGTAPTGIAIGDLDMDGKNDLAVTNYGSNTISTFRNTSTSGSITTGSLSVKADFSTIDAGVGANGKSPFGITINDLDLDGKLDLAVTANGTSGTVSRIINSSTSGLISFYLTPDLTAGSLPQGVVVGDLDGDGKSEIVVANENSSTISIFRNSCKAYPVITWPTPSAITYGTALSSTQLNATSNVPGTFTYNPVVGTIPPAAVSYTLSVGFAPTDAANYMAIPNTTVQLQVNQAVPVVTWSNPTSITYGTTLNSTQLNATANVPGTFNYSPPAGTVLNAGVAQTLSVNFVPTDNVDYTSVNNTQVQITVNKATPIITWANPTAITYGTPLSSTQLNATANIPGTFTYSPSLGTILNTGSNQNLSVNFVPTDNVNYNSVNNTQVQITVNKASPIITWSNPTAITYGTALSSTQLNATASVPGTLSYSPPLGTILNAGANQNLSVSFVPNDIVNYNSVSNTQVQITVNKATPVITWPNPSSITYGTAISTTQLNATANVPGTFNYSPALGTMLNAGANQTLTVNFVPTDATDYNSVSNTQVQITVNKATPVITWSNPSTINYGTALSSTQLNAGASVPGTLTYNPPIGTILNAGANQTLSVDFVPTDGTDYNSVLGTQVQLTVNGLSQTITFSSLPNVTVGDPTFTLSASASSSLPISYSTSSGKVTLNGSIVTIVSAGRDTITASQSGSFSYNAAQSVSQSFCINPAQPTITISGANTSSPTLTSSAAFGNQWFLNGTAITNATNNTLSVAAAGIYTVQAKVDDCVSLISSNFLIIF